MIDVARPVETVSGHAITIVPRQNRHPLDMTIAGMPFVDANLKAAGLDVKPAHRETDSGQT